MFHIITGKCHCNVDDLLNSLLFKPIITLLEQFLYLTSNILQQDDEKSLHVHMAGCREIFVSVPYKIGGPSKYCSRHGFLHQRMNANGSDTK